MSSIARIPRYERAIRYLGGFRYGDLIVKSVPLIAVAFILYVILHGTFW